MSFSEFYQRSINEPEQFWAEQARRIDWQTPFTQTLDHSNPPFARWFCEGRTNLCHNAIDRWLEKQPEALALIAVSSETEEERTFTFRQLHDEVNAVASMLRSLGVQRGDRVLVYMPMIAEAHITLLACARIGAIHSVVFGGFASHSVAARIDDAKPVLIVSADAGARGGKIIPYKKLLDDAISQAQHQPRHVLLVDRGLAKMARVSGGMSISRRCAINTSARGYRWRGWNLTKPPAFSTPPARPANLKACSVTSADMRWRWRPRWTPFLAAKRAVCSFVLRISAGWWGIRISSTRRCWRGWRLSFTKDYRPGRTAACGGKSSRNIRLAGCSQRRPPFAC